MARLCVDCSFEMKSVVRQELLGLKNKVDYVKLNYETLFDDRSSSSSNVSLFDDQSSSNIKSKCSIL